MFYLGTPSSPKIRAAMSAGEIGCMTTPAQGNIVPPGAWWAADNGKFGQGWPGMDAWWLWLCKQVGRWGPERCLWALAPDVPFDAVGTLAESQPSLERIRLLGVPAAFAAQDGCEHGLVPWGKFDVLFLAGSTEWKTGSAAERLSRQAADQQVPVHMGRVNTRGRLEIAEWFGCTFADGTCFTRGPDKNLSDMTRWLDYVHRQPTLLSR